MTLMIQPSEVVTLAIENPNLDDGFFTEKIIEMCQVRYIKPKLGKKLYDDVIADIAGSELSTANETLWTNYIKPALAYYVFFEALPDIYTQIGNQGLRLNTEQFSESASANSFSHYRNNKSGRAEWYLNEMITFLKDNKTDYPLFDGCDTDRPKSKYFVIY